jgi:hypothetical protein
MDTISSKAAMSLACQDKLWLHEEAWEVEHIEFAANCQIFENTGPFKETWNPSPAQIARFRLFDHISTKARWLLVDRSNKKNIFGAARLQWQQFNFRNAFVTIKFKDGCILSDDQNHPLHWLIEAIFARLCPDQLTLFGSYSSNYKHQFNNKAIHIPTRSFDMTRRSLSEATVIELDQESWLSFSMNTLARTNLDWITKSNRRQEAIANQPKKEKPFIIRLLTSFSSMRRKKAPRRKTVHPIDRYKKPFITW